jgi:hypothetical protein
MSTKTPEKKASGGKANALQKPLQPSEELAAAASEAAADPEPPMANGDGAGGAEGPRFGHKRIVGLCSGTWYPLDLFGDLPGPVERYGIEVFSGTEANRDGEYVRVSKEFATRQEAEYLMA